MLQASPYPWRDIRGCSCRRACSGVPQSGKFTWFRWPDAFGLLSFFRTGVVTTNVLGSGDCDWIGEGTFEAEGSEFAWQITYRYTFSGPPGTAVGYSYAISVIEQVPFGVSYGGTAGVSRVYPWDCRESPDPTWAPPTWAPLGYPVSGWGGPCETLFGWLNFNPF